MVFTREREGKGMRGREGKRKIFGEEDGSLHVASETKDMGNERGKYRACWSWILGLN